MFFYHKICKSVFCFLLSGFGSSLYAQHNIIKGIVADTTEKKNLHYAIVALISLTDSTLTTSVRTNEAGEFAIPSVSAGHYLLMVSYPRMADFLKEIFLSDTSKINLGKIAMDLEVNVLQEVIVRSGAAITMKGDTLEYTADSFAVRAGANVEDLLKRLPGIRVEQNGKIYAQGKEVKRILVDGDEFFADDPVLASKYLNADAINKVQVFDQKSESATFTGIDDGSRTKTINLTLKKDKNSGAFGKLSSGGDFKNYYNHDAMGALFKGARKISVFGLASKTGNTGITSNELTQYVGQDYELINDGSGNLTYINNGFNDYDGDTYYGNGIPKVLYGGAHYSDRWNDSRQKLFTNYRTKQIDAEGWSNSNRTTTLPDSTTFHNQSDNTETSHSFVQKGSGSFAVRVDSLSTLKLSLNGRIDNGNTSTASNETSVNERGIEVNNSRQQYRRFYKNQNFGSNFMYQHKFRTHDQTFSIALQQEYSHNDNDNYNLSANQYYDASSGAFMRADTLNQLQNSNTSQHNYAAEATYTRKLSKHLHLEADYGWKNAQSTNDFTTFNNENGKYSERVDTLSNNYNFTVRTHIAGATFSYTQKKLTITAGSKLYFSQFKQVNNTDNTERNRHFINFAPQLNASLQIKENTSFSVNYSGTTSQPAVEQLQPLRRSSNPLYVQIGNPNLRQAFSHSVSLSYNYFNWVKGINFYAFASAYYQANGITAAATTDAQNRTVSQFINLDGIPGFNGSLNYSKEIKKAHLRPSAGLSFSRNGNYSVLNGVTLKNQNFSTNANLSCGYDWQEKLSITYNATVLYNAGSYNAPAHTVNRTWSHTHTLDAKAFLPAKLELGTDANLLFQPRNAAFNSSLNVFKWNAYVQRKFLKNEKGFIKFSVNDILNNNTGYVRYVYGNNITEQNRLVIKRYWLVTLGWNFSKSFK